MRVGPGRACPLHYRYRPGELARAQCIEADVAWVVGGLYGNVEALHAIEAAVERERATGASIALVFNGDFHWFDADPDDFRDIEAGVADGHAIAGNVERELADPDPDAGCGCAYPGFVDDATVAYSNRIIERLRATAQAVSGARERLAALPRLLRLRIGDRTTGVIHGDPESVAGWQFAIERAVAPDQPLTRERVVRWAGAGAVDAFACTHTCLPWAGRFGPVTVINNGSAGMPNFRGDPRGLVTRIAPAGSHHPDALHGLESGGTRWEAVAVDFDTGAWWQRFVRTWPPGSPAHESYAGRLRHGPAFTREQAWPASGQSG